MARAQNGAEQLLRAAGLGEQAVTEVAEAIMAAAKAAVEGRPTPNGLDKAAPAAAPAEPEPEPEPTAEPEPVAEAEVEDEDPAAAEEEPEAEADEDEGPPEPTG
jgi:hypothetical protein